ncbi:MAG: ATP-binding cassette domain-containing protein [Candidatus Rehaiarchaeum fermentans]|nr:ATP-binding cassette domain-containing protein [Candidatus Rehaiarchaeum fermentans]
MGIITLKKVSVYYNERQLLKNIDLEINNDVVLILGKNGAGKTTLANAITGFLPNYLRFEGEMKIGEFSINAQNYNKYRERKGNFKEISKILSYVPQEPAEILDPTFKAIDQIYEPVYYSNKSYLISRILERAKLTRARIEEIAQLALKDRDRLVMMLSNNRPLLDQIYSVFRYEGFESDIADIISNKLSKKPKNYILNFLKNYKIYSKIPIISSILNNEIKKEAIEYAKELALIFNIKEEFLEKYPSQLSGGLRQLILLAASLAGWPKIIILDEPTSNLDSVAQFNLVNALIRIKKLFNMGLLIVSHDAPLIDIADRVYIINNGEIVDSGDSKSIKKSTNEYTKKLLSPI